MLRQTRSSSKTILAIAPGKREFGIAVFEGIQLAHFSLRILRNRRSNKCLRKGIVELIQYCICIFQPQVIAVRTISQYQNKSIILKSIVRVVEEQADVNQIPLVEISMDQVKIMLCNNEKPTLTKAFENITVLYPELKQFFSRPNKWQNDYYHNLFSAVSVGVALLRSRSKSA